MGDRGTIEILVRDEGNLVARSGNVLIQVRSGAMTELVLARIESSARLLRAATTGPVGAIAIIEEGASLAAPALRARQVEVVRSLLADPRTHLAAVVMGQSVGTRAVRTVMRLALLGAPRLHLAATPSAAVEWLHRHLAGASAADLMAAVDRARAAARGGPPA